MRNVLIIEDDPEIINLISIHLKDIDSEVSSAEDGPKGLQMALENDYDLILLDLMLPQMDGIEVCQKLRAKKSTPIIMLTAKAEEIDKVLGLEIGADDYITKPFSVRELLSRIKAIFRRTKMIEESFSESVNPKLEFEGLSLDIEMRKVLVNGAKIELSSKEFELLVLLASNPGRSYDRPELLRLVWGYEFDGYEHTVNSHINRLRAKIENDMANPKYILTTWGVGYKFNEEMAKTETL